MMAQGTGVANRNTVRWTLDLWTMSPGNLQLSLLLILEFRIYHKLADVWVLRSARRALAMHLISKRYLETS